MVNGATIFISRLVYVYWSFLLFFFYNFFISNFCMMVQDGTNRRSNIMSFLINFSPICILNFWGWIVTKCDNLLLLSRWNYYARFTWPRRTKNNWLPCYWSINYSNYNERLWFRPHLGQVGFGPIYKVSVFTAKPAQGYP